VPEENFWINYILMPIVIQGLSAMSCTKTAEPIEMQFGMLSQVDPGNMYYMGM